MGESDVLYSDKEGETVPWHFAVGGAVDESVDGVGGGVDLAGAVDALQRRTVDHGRVHCYDIVDSQPLRRAWEAGTSVVTARRRRRRNGTHE